MGVCECLLWRKKQPFGPSARPDRARFQLILGHLRARSGYNQPLQSWGRGMTSFFGELRRRNVVKVAVAYIHSVDADRLCRVSIPLPNKALVASERFMRPSHQQFLTLASCMRL